tara:strand:+ start:23 stop:217 length:195 start_codon:yes stop_codon:yes gene_type:complete
MQSKFSNSDLARLSIVLNRFIKSEPQNSSDGLEELDIKLKEIVKSNSHADYSININGIMDSLYY